MALTLSAVTEASLLYNEKSFPKGVEWLTMNYQFFAEFLEKTQFPAPACECLTKLAHEIEAEIMNILAFYEKDYDHEATVPLMDELARKSGHSVYSLWMVLLILAAEKSRPLYPSEEMFWECYKDLRYKVQECYDTLGVWGTFVAFWYPRYYKGTIFTFGRLQYEVRTGVFTEPITLCAHTFGPETTTLHIHIPTSYAPFDRETRMDSYRQAFKFYCKDGRPLICFCASWLLYPPYDAVFAPQSNIADFRRDFHIFKWKQTEKFGDNWRVFGKDRALPAEQLPERTSLQRAFKAYMQDGGSFGTGTGILIFDGKKIITRT